MLTIFKEKTSSAMGNGPNGGEKKPNEEFDEDSIFKKTLQFDGSNRRKSTDGLIFFAGTDKARVIAEILEERGWSRTKDQNVTNFTIKWCLAHQVDWNQFQEGKQLINNIPGQLAFSDKINLWYTIRDYLRNRHTLDGNHIQTFLPMTFVLDEENEVADFLRSYKKQNRTWICKPRYSFAGRGIYVLSGNSDLNSIFKFKVGVGNRLQHEPRLSGYLMQEYIARPLLIKGRKFDIRVHWLVAWTKPLLVFYNHNASVVRLSLNLYREFDFDRATHLTNLSVQENHSRYPFSQEATGMTLNQLNQYFNQCFRPFHPKMCQDWVMTVMQERMQTIIRHVIRASKDKLTRGAGQFGFFGCDFLLDENFRTWLLEINDNPGVGWGNPRLNTTTKPLFEETLNIVFECFEKYNKGQPILPIECLKNYQLIYNEDEDADRLIRDDNQIFTERLSIRYVTKESLSRSSFRRILPRVNTSRTSTHQNDNNNNSDIVLPFINMRNSNSSINDIIPPNSTIIDTTPLIPSIVSPTPFSLSRVDTIPLIPLLVGTRPVSSSLIDATPLNPLTHSTTSFNVSEVTGTPLSSNLVNTTDDTDETIEPLKHDDDIELERLMKPKTSEQISKTNSFLPTPTLLTRPNTKINKTSFKRTISTATTFGMQRKKRIDLTPVIFEHRRYIHRRGIIPPCTETTKKKDKLLKNRVILKDQKQDQIQNQDSQSVIASLANIDLLELDSLTV